MVGLEGPIAQELLENINLSLHAVLGTIENGRTAGLVGGSVTPSNFYLVAFPEPVCCAMPVFDVVGPCLMGISCYQSKGVNCGYALHMLSNIISICETHTVRVISRKRLNC